MESLRILALSDLHGQFAAFPPDELPDADLAVIAGDITDQGFLSPDFEPATAWMRAMAERYRAVLYVPGNHDLGVGPHAWSWGEPGGVAPWCADIDQQHVSVNGLSVLGSSLSPCFDAPVLAEIWTHMTASREADQRAWEHAPAADIVLSHCPPLQCRDEGGTHGSGQFLGSPGLRAWAERCPPRLIVCGHVHEAAGFGIVGRTAVFNVARAVVRITLEPEGALSWEVERYVTWPAPDVTGRWTPS